MRKNFVFFVLIPLLIIAVVLYFFIDRWIEAGLEYAGQHAIGSVVEIDNLSLSLSPLGITMSRLQVANPDDPWFNLFETRSIRFAMDPGQLLRGKYIIETMEVHDCIVGTKRTTYGMLPGSASKRESAASKQGSFTALAEEILARSVEKTPIFDPAMLRRGINIDSLIKAVDLRSISHIETLKTRAALATTQWKATLADVEQTKQRLVAMDSAVRSINPSALKDVASITAALKTVDDTRKNVNDIVTTYTTRRDAMSADMQQISTAVAAIDDIAADDYRKILALARLPEVDAMGIAEVLLGKQLLQEVRTYLSYVDLAREKIQNYTARQDIETPPRMEGQDIHFPTDRAYPKLWIKSISVSGGTDQAQNPEFFYARGLVRNITSDQRVTGIPLTIDLKGSRGTTVAASLSALFDRTRSEPLDEYRAGITGVPLASYSLGREDFLPATIKNATLGTNIVVTIPGRKFDARAELDFRNMEIVYAAAPANIGERLAREVLSGVSGFDVDLRLWQSAEGFKAALATDLDEQFASRVKKVLGAELAKLRAEVRAKVNGFVNAKRREFEAVYAAKRAEAEKRLAEYQAIVTENIALLEAKKKELEERLEKEKQSRVDEAVKKIFKR